MIRYNKERKPVMEEVSVPVSVVCNKCGKSKTLQGKEDYENEWELEEFPSFDTYFGYGSRWDNESWSFNLCEDCLESFVMSFQYAPDGWGVDNFTNKESTQARFEYEKETGKTNGFMLSFVMEGMSDREMLEWFNTDQEEINQLRDWYRDYYLLKHPPLSEEEKKQMADDIRERQRKFEEGMKNYPTKEELEEIEKNIDKDG